jgi:hypothetical protein
VFIGQEADSIINCRRVAGFREGFFVRAGKESLASRAMFYDFVGLFLQTLLTLPFTFVIIVGFALKGEDFCPAEALQVVCSVDDGPKTDWQVVCIQQAANAGASWEPI